jgi:hypothetical protein
MVSVPRADVRPDGPASIDELDPAAAGDFFPISFKNYVMILLKFTVKDTP